PPDRAGCSPRRAYAPFPRISRRSPERRAASATLEVRASFLISFRRGTALAHDAGRDELRIRGFVNADFGKKIAVMLAQLGRRRADRARRAREPRHDVVHGKCAHVWIGIVGDQLALED